MGFFSRCDLEIDILQRKMCRLLFLIHFLKKAKKKSASTPPLQQKVRSWVGPAVSTRRITNIKKQTSMIPGMHSFGTIHVLVVGRRAFVSKRE